ncbi:MAG: PilZ domain-containing protein [Candidatus Aminicenantaceae bacterium]
MTASNERRVESRRFPRLKVQFNFNPPSIFGSRGRIFNVSLGGVRIYSDKWYKVGKLLEIEIFLPTENSLVATVRVVWIKNLPPDSDNLFDIGLEFVTLPFDGTDELQRVLEHIPSTE